jgi:hypothetical protein
VFVGAEEPDQRDQHDRHRHQEDHPDGQEDHALHRHVPRRSGVHVVILVNILVNKFGDFDKNTKIDNNLVFKEKRQFLQKLT